MRSVLISLSNLPVKSRMNWFLFNSLLLEWCRIFCDIFATDSLKLMCLMRTYALHALITVVIHRRVACFPTMTRWTLDCAQHSRNERLSLTPYYCYPNKMVCDFYERKWSYQMTSRHESGIAMSNFTLSPFFFYCCFCSGSTNTLIHWFQLNSYLF